MGEFNSSGIVTLLTDFGTMDNYVGQMKGVLLSLNPTLRIVDLTHGVAPQDIDEGAFQLGSARGVFPSGTVHVAVVDPGVGTNRRAVCVVAEGHVYIGPDNGLLTPALAEASAAFEILSSAVIRRSVTATFHGRDIFAPAAGHIATGLAPAQLGPAVNVTDLTRLPPAVELGDGVTRGKIVSIDRFGNCITRLTTEHCRRLGALGGVTCGDFHVSELSRTFADVGLGAPLALIGSSGTVELAIRNGSAAARFGLQRGDWVELYAAGDD